MENIENKFDFCFIVIICMRTDEKRIFFMNKNIKSIVLKG
jgi:CMP-N-acetylneuraminic acid synthetase